MRSSNGSPDGLADELGISPHSLKSLRRKYRMEHGAEAEEKLGRFLSGLVEWKRRQDAVRLLGRRSGYVETRFAAIRVRGVQNEEEPEAIPADLQEEFSRNGWQTMDVLKAEENARRESRSRAERLRQYEMELRREGVSPARQLAVIEGALEEMRQMRRNGNST